LDRYGDECFAIMNSSTRYEWILLAKELHLLQNRKVWQVMNDDKFFKPKRHEIRAEEN